MSADGGPEEAAGPNGDASGEMDANTEADASSDAEVVSDAEADAAPDAASCPTPLLVGGTDVTTQGWSTAAAGSNTLTYGADYVRLQTSTSGPTSGALLLYLPGAVESGVPFKVRFEMLVEAVQTHNQYDSAAAILGSFTLPYGNTAQRSQMVYVDSANVGWADNTQSASASPVDAQYHAYELSVDALNVARLSVDGVEKLTRSNFTTNGTIAIGDQTNDPNVDSTLRIRSVTQLCP